ncbi:MAG TPA: glycine betaine ABC transporter substrate-binding protein [Armatimonadota bacterium]|nr:glycine betaine ABC transporter substrate-binding protein [Armatimonadota bacterium]
MKRLQILLLALVAVLVLGGCLTKPRVTLGSKAFPESWILSDALASLVREAGGVEVEHKSNLGGTDIVYQALRQGSIDAYPEYTGTVAEVLMKSTGRPTLVELRQFLQTQGVGMSDSLGFNDGYALAVTAATQEKYGLRKISDLAAHPELRLGFTHEFVGRKDGWAGLARHYGLSMPNVRGMEHQLAYGALSSGQIDLMEIYTTDAKIGKLGLRMLEDDRQFFPRYDAVILYRLDLPQRAPQAFSAMQRLVGKIDEARMIRANGLVELEKKRPQEAAATLLGETLGSAAAPAESGRSSMWSEIGKNTLQHLQLVAISLLAAILVGIPLGVLAARSRTLASATLSGTGLLQTIPSLALLAFLIPRFGIGVNTALIALFLYSLLPIVRNTYTGLTTIPPQLAEAAEALGLSPSARLLRVTLPMASPAIMAGIKTSAVINVGTATLAALIGAGGLGDPILRGISLMDNDLILQGAIPAALLALLAQWGFDLLDRLVVPHGLRLAEGNGPR